MRAEVLQPLYILFPDQTLNKLLEQRLFYRYNYFTKLNS